MSAAVTIEEWREQMLPHFTATQEELLQFLRRETDRIANALQLERRLFVETTRVKEADRAAKTAARRRLDYWRLEDWVGLRVSCPTPEAAYHVSIALNSLSAWRCAKRFDYNVNPKISGYRGIHAYGRVLRGERGAEVEVACELQVHTRLQTLWSDLTHDDIYKPGGALSVLAKDTSTNLAAYMAATDQLIGRMLGILRTPEAQLKPFEGPHVHNWIAGLALLHPALTGDEVDAAIGMLREIGMQSDEDLQRLLDRWTWNIDRLHGDVRQEWKAAGCREPTRLDTLSVAARLMIGHVKNKEQQRAIGDWARERAEKESGAPAEEDDV